MVWLTWWPLVLGFSLSGLVQSGVAREGLRRELGRDTVSSLAKASFPWRDLLVVQLAMRRAPWLERSLPAARRGPTPLSSWSLPPTLSSNSASCSIFILGWRFLVAQLVGGVVMIVLLGLLTRVVFRSSRVDALRERVQREEAPSEHTPSGSWRTRLRDRETLVAGRSLHDGRSHDDSRRARSGVSRRGLLERARTRIVVAPPLRERTWYVDGA